MDRVYTAEATASGARTGDVASSDGRLELQLSRPEEMGGDGGPGTNPEQLFAAGYAACFHSAMRFGLKELGLPPSALEGSSVTAAVHFLRGEPGDFGLAVDLSARLPQLDEEQARQLMEKTHTVCPYSRATAGNVEVGLHVVPTSS
ncbi:organic hydroperoxide resistance protein [Geodermatophilus sp. DSM 44513]|uniref:organic hydroperoxide resistance protein n=1 Tax=Geodermatophilus sp. DSM 44513 TaxID=1528104 RepID=UPI0012749F36|nr:organic hydroperoxide resistance protein [Geodermatophilus sp. DSM 44513]WNV76336.1 organic hydroperoxide resistance protein [Geodermatophilus sp. DSM 44513]